MEMKKISWIKIIAMMLVLCMLLTSCSVLEGAYDTVCGWFGIGDDDTDDDTDNTTPDEENPNPDELTPCQHPTTKVTNAKPTTCTKAGYTGDTVCAVCGTILAKGSEIPIAEHSYDAGMITKTPTCISTGTFTYTCTGCGTTKSDELPTVGHLDEYHDMLDGTHNHTCSTCTMTENEEHVPTDDGMYVPASCEESAYTLYECSVCDGVYKVYDEDSAPTGHAYGDWYVVDPTCVDDGYKIRVCQTCGNDETINIPATPDTHNYEFAYYDGDEPSCNVGAVAVYVCVDCYESSYTKDVPATGMHSYKDLENNGDGWIRKMCQTCEKIVSTFDASQVKEAEVKAEAIPDDVPFEVNTQNAAIEFPTDVIGQLKGGEDVKIGADILTDEVKSAAIESATNLTPEEKERLENVDLFDFNVTVDGESLGAGFNAAVTVTIPYQLKTLIDENGNEYLEDKDGIVIWFVAEDGTIEKITGVTYNEENETVTFSAEHFSMYAVAYEETQEMKCRRGYHDYEVLYVVETSCSNFGYTALRCTCCHRNTIDYIVEKLDHNYGELINPVPTCTSGDYYHRICVDCGDYLAIRYVRALGHVLENVATCEEGAYCSRCDSIAIPALGHNWTEWRVVVEAGPLTNGLRVRYCLRCGQSQESTTASTGDITKLEFDSYEELIAAIYDQVIGLDKGVIELSFYLDGVGPTDVKFTVDRSGEDLLVLLEYEMGQGEFAQSGAVLYKNGVIIGDMAGQIGVFDIDTLFATPMDVVAAYMQAYYNLINPYIEMGLLSMREQLEMYVDVLGDDINAALEAAGSEYRVEELLDLMDSIETVYAYVSLKLGYTTCIEIKDGVAVPTKNDLVNLIKAFMDETQDGEYTTYTYDDSELVTTIETIATWLYEASEKDLATFIFEEFGDVIAKLDASIVDAESLATYLKTKFPGTLLVSDAINVIAGILDDSGFMTLDDLYGLINELMVQSSGEEEFDIEMMLSEYYDLTLNDLASAMFDGEEVTAEDLYDYLVYELTETYLGDMYLGGISFGELAEMVYYYAVMMFDYGIDFTFTVDGYGKLVSLSLDQFVNASVPEEDGSVTEILAERLVINVTKDDTVEVTVPDKFAPVDVELDHYIDDEGNYVVSGIPSDAELQFNLIGDEKVSLDDMLTLDSVMSEELGFNVYAMPEQFWTRNEHVESLVEWNGKYYGYNTQSVNNMATGDEKYIGSMDLFEFLEDPASILPTEETQPVGTYQGMPVYTSPIGYLVEDNGEWWVCDAHVGYVKEAYKGDDKEVYDEEIGAVFGLEHLSLRFNFKEMFLDQDIMLSSIEDHYYDKDYYFFGVNYNVKIDIYLGYETYEFYGVSNSDGVTLVYIPEGHYKLTTELVYVLGDEVSLSEFEYDNYSYYYNEFSTIQVNGEKIDVDVVTTISLQRLAPDYFVKVADGIYLYLNTKYGIADTIVGIGGTGADGSVIIGGINSTVGNKVDVLTSSCLVQNVNVSGCETITLNDGNTLYVIGTAFAESIGYSYGEVAYGYVEVIEGNYLRTYCVYQDGYMVDVVYEGSGSEITLSYDDIYDLDDYITRSGNVITVSKELINKLLNSCTEANDYVAVVLRAVLTVDDTDYYFIVRDYLKYNLPDEITLPGASSEDRVDAFYALFYGYDDGESPRYNIYVNEDGDLVIEGAVISRIDAEFKNWFPADPFLEYDEEMSDATGLDIWSYDYYDNAGNTFVLIDGKYYYYDWQNNYDIEKMSLSDIIKNNWYLADVRYCFDIYPHEDTPEELHNKPVYDIYLSFINDGGYIVTAEDAKIHIYAIVLDGKFQVLTGAVPAGESLVTFEGYMPIDEYMNSLRFEVVGEENNLDEYWEESYYYIINGVQTKLTRVNVMLTESAYGITYYINLYKAPDGKYVTNAAFIDEYMMVRDEATILDNYVFTKTYQKRYCNGVYTLAEVNWTYTHRYYAIRIGGVFYDYDDYRNNWYDQITDLEDFKNSMYDTDRVYVCWDDEYGCYRFYDKFIPGVFIEGYEELDGFELPTDEYNWSQLGNTKEGYAFYEIVYYIDESIDPEIEVTVLDDGHVFYHIDGIGYVKLAEDHYVKAVLYVDEYGNTSARCYYRRAYIYDYALENCGYLDEYFNRTDKSITIPKEMVEYMDEIPDHCAFSVTIGEQTIIFNYYVLDSYFNGDFGGDYDSGLKGDGDFGYVTPDKNGK